MNVDSLSGKTVTGTTTHTHQKYELSFENFSPDKQFSCPLTVNGKQYDGQCVKTGENTVCSKFPEYLSMYHDSLYHVGNEHYHSDCNDVTYEFRNSESAIVTECSDCVKNDVTIK